MRFLAFAMCLAAPFAFAQEEDPAATDDSDRHQIVNNGWRATQLELCRKPLKVHDDAKLYREFTVPSRDGRRRARYIVLEGVPAAFAALNEERRQASIGVGALQREIRGYAGGPFAKAGVRADGTLVGLWVPRHRSPPYVKVHELDLQDGPAAEYVFAATSDPRVVMVLYRTAKGPAYTRIAPFCYVNGERR